MTKEEKAIREFCGQHADWWPSITQVQEMLALAHPKQEPVKDWIASHNEICALLRQAHDALVLTSYPPQRTWVGLSDEEIKSCWNWETDCQEWAIEFARAILRKAQEK